MSPPPGPPGPGGQPPAPGGGPYGPPPGPYGAAGPPHAPPPGPYATSPYAANPYGAWPPPPVPPRKRLGGGAITAITLGGVLLLVVVLFTVSSLLMNADDEKLTLPATLNDGAYTKVPNNAAVREEQRGFQRELPSDATAVVGTYEKSGSSDDRLVLSGAWGNLGPSAPALMRHMMLSGTDETTSAKDRRDFQPRGSEGPTITCQLSRMRGGSAPVYAPACAWADRSTAAVVILPDLPEGTAPDEVSLRRYAATTARVKAETTEPA